MGKALWAGAFASSSSTDAPALASLPRAPCSPFGGGTAPAGAAVLNSSSEEALCFIAFIYYHKTSACFLRQLSAPIGTDKQCWSVFPRQPKFITLPLFIYFFRLWWWPGFFFR